MGDLLQKIDVLKNKIVLAINSFGFYSEFKYIRAILFDELNSYNYELSDEMSLKKYYAWLQEFYEGRIEVINKRIADNDNNSVFDNSTDEQHNEIKKHKKEIESLLEYIKNNYPEFSKSIIEAYEKLNKYYEEQYKFILENGKKKLNIDLGIGKEPALSLYQDAYVLMRSYIIKLDNFNALCSNMKKFVEKDTRIKETFRRACEIINDSSVIEMINKMEINYKQAMEISIKNSFSLGGIESIQENVLNQCIKLEELISKENEKKDYYNQIFNMTLNIEFDKLMEIINYVETNNIYKEELLNNLYALIEKEKYLLKNYNSEPRIYNALSENLKVELEKKFISGLIDYKEDEATDIINKLKKYGYIRVPDKKYYDYYSKQSFDNEIELDIEEPKYKIINSVYKTEYPTDSFGYYRDRWRFTLVISDRKDLPIRSLNHLSYENDIVFMKKNAQYIIEMRDYLILGYGIDNDKKVIINLKTGKATKIKQRMNEQVFDLILGYDTKKKKLFVYDSCFKLVHTVDNYNDVNADYRKYQFLIKKDDKPDINIYDKDFNFVKSIKLPFEYEYMIFANDGVLTLRCANDEIIYYDYINMKKIDSFKYSNILFQELVMQYVYSEGLYVYNDKKEYKGYKDLEGNIVIEPKYIYATPFVGNVAVVIKHQQKGIIDRTGNFIPMEEVYRKLYQKKKSFYETEAVNPNKIDIGDSLDYLWSPYWGDKRSTLKPDYEEGKYKFVFDVFHNGQNKGHLITKIHYRINIDKPIVNIDFNSKKEQKVLSKTL